MNTHAATASITASAKQLRLPALRQEYERICADAEKARSGYLPFLAECLNVEVDDRNLRRITRRIADAKFPRMKHLGDFNIDVSPITSTTIATLVSAKFIETATPVVFLGDSGTGKTHLLIGTGLSAAQSGKKVRYVTCAQLVNELAEAASDKQLSKVVSRYGRLDLLCIDELGYVQLDPRGAELLFQVITERDEKSSIAVASNAPFSEWGQVFTDPRLVAAVVDRLTFNALIIETGSDSYRLRSTRHKKGDAEHHLKRS